MRVILNQCEKILPDIVLTDRSNGMKIFCKTKNLQSSYYLAEGRPEDSDSVKVLLLDLEAPGNPEVLFAV